MTQPDDTKRICLTCIYWEGDREKMNAEIDRASFDIAMGWPEEGGCQIDYEWSEIDVVGDAIASLSVSANFGCVRWEG